MKALLVAFSMSLVILMAPSLCLSQEEAKLSVLSFSWHRYVVALNVEPDWSSKAPTRQQQIDDRERQSIERGYGDLIRSRDLRRIERAARNSAKPSDLFIYKAKVRNFQAKTIRNVFWEYQIIDTANAANPSRRQFFCWQKIKVNGVANLAAVSVAPPLARTISVRAGRSPKEASVEKVVINRIEFTDGSVWQRDGWDFPIPAAAALPTQKRATGEPACTGF